MPRSHYVNAKSTAQISETFFPTPTHSFSVPTTSVLQNKQGKKKVRRRRQREKVGGKRAGFFPAEEQISSVRNKCKPVRYVLEGSNTQDSPPEARKQVDQRRHAITRNLEPYGFLKSVRKNSIRHMLRQRLHINTL